MKNCHWGEDRQWSECGGRARRQVLPSSSVSLGPAILTRVHCSTHTIKCQAGETKKAVILELGQQKGEKQESQGKQGYIACFTHTYFLSRFPANSVCQCQEIPRIPTSNRRWKENSRMTTKCICKWVLGVSSSDNWPGSCIDCRNVDQNWLGFQTAAWHTCIQNPKALQVSGCV